MNLNDYISTGIIESYVLGIADEEETRQIEELAEKYPGIKKEIDSTAETLENYALLHSMPPPEGLKEKIIARLTTSLQEPPEKTKKVKAKKDEKYKLAAAAAISLLIVSATLNYIFYDNWQQTSTQFDQLNSEKEAIAAQNEELRSKYTEVRNKLEVINSPNNEILKMKGAAPAPQSAATVYWNRDTKAVFVNIIDLPEAPSGKQYQFWCLHNGNPTSLGVFDIHQQEEFRRMKKIQKADGFAVTLEEAGGSKNPSFDQLYLRCASWAKYYETSL